MKSVGKAYVWVIRHFFIIYILFFLILPLRNLWGPVVYFVNNGFDAHNALSCFSYVMEEASCGLRLLLLDGSAGLVIGVSMFATFVILRTHLWWAEKKWRIYMEAHGAKHEFDECESPSYKKSTRDFVDFFYPKESEETNNGHFPFPYFLSIYKWRIVDVFRAFLDLHKDGWRMKIFPFSKERLAEEKRLSEERGEEYVIYPDVEDAIRRAEEADREIERIGEI